MTNADDTAPLDESDSTAHSAVYQTNRTDTKKPGAIGLPEPAERQLLHRRRVSCDGYQRADGLWDIEACLNDSKTQSIMTMDGIQREPGEPIHLMWLRLTLDETMLVQEVALSMQNHPYRHCAEIEPAFQQLVGERIGRGWHRSVRDKLGGINGCAHLVELLQPIATTAYQTMFEVQHKRTGSVPLNGCHAWSESGRVVKEFYPQFYREPGTR